MGTAVYFSSVRDRPKGSSEAPTGVRKLEEKVVLVAVEKETLAEAFAYLKERLDPEEDIFEAAAKFRRMAWSPGEPILDFFTRYLEEAVKAGLSAKAACVFMVSQSPVEVQPKLKDWIRPKGNDLFEDGAHQFGTVILRMLTEKGISVDHICRVQHVTEASPLVEPDKPGEASDDSNEPVYPKVQQVSRERRERDYNGRPERLQGCPFRAVLDNLTQDFKWSYTTGTSQGG